MKETIILIIDDNDGDRSLWQAALENAVSINNIRTIEAICGESGLQAIEETYPHCVILDYSLPGNNGIEVLKNIRAKHPHLPVIMLTGQGNEKIAVEAIKEGAQDYIGKSLINSENLQRIVRNAIAHGSLQSRIEEQRASLEIFTHALAHDLKEPVRTIRSFLERIPDWQTLSEKSQRSFYYIRKAADRMNALIDTVYLYTRLDGAEQMEKTDCDLSSIIQEVKENLAQLIDERKATIMCDVLPNVHANNVQMIQLFQNLIANAIKHCVTPVTININAIQVNNKWQISVHDNGPGMASEYLTKIFDPFKRMSYQKGQDAGLGLGLAINRKIVESYNCRIWCESELGRGSSFIFTLPRVAGKTLIERILMHPRGLPEENANAQRKFARILLVDDNDADIELSLHMLTEEARMRCDILTATNGQAALAILDKAAQENNPIDLVLLDINMPVMTGFELLSTIRMEYQGINPKIVICTTSATDIDKQKAAAHGAVDYLSKPAEFSQLKNIIQSCSHIQLQKQGADYALFRAA